MKICETMPFAASRSIGGVVSFVPSDSPASLIRFRDGEVLATDGGLISEVAWRKSRFFVVVLRDELGKISNHLDK